MSHEFCKQNFFCHLAQPINTKNLALYTLFCRIHSKKEELLNLLTSNIYSILYYNSEIWHLPSLKPTLKQKLLSASARALKVYNTLVDSPPASEASRGVY